MIRISPTLDRITARIVTGPRRKCVTSVTAASAVHLNGSTGSRRRDVLDSTRAASSNQYSRRRTSLTGDPSRDAVTSTCSEESTRAPGSSPLGRSANTRYGRPAIAQGEAAVSGRDRGLPHHVVRFRRPLQEHAGIRGRSPTRIDHDAGEGHVRHRRRDDEVGECGALTGGEGDGAAVGARRLRMKHTRAGQTSLAVTARVEADDEAARRNLRDLVASRRVGQRAQPLRPEWIVETGGSPVSSIVRPAIGRPAGSTARPVTLPSANASPRTSAQARASRNSITRGVVSPANPSAIFKPTA